MIAITAALGRSNRRHRVLACAGPLLALAGCTGRIDAGSGGDAPFVAPGADPGAAPSDPPGTRTPGTPAQASPDAGGAGEPRDVQRVAIHRLNNLEYDLTVRDLLGVSATPAASFIADEKALGFDNIAAALGMTEAQYEQYFNSAATVTDAAFADAALRARIVTCEPSTSAEQARCSETIAREFGSRAWRRPLSDAEVARLAALAADARELGEDFPGSIAHLVRALLSSVQFLYRIELDDDPASPSAHALSDYELAARLSYLLWSTMPDDALFELAEQGALQDDDELRAQLSRMLDDPRAARFTSGFAAQWLGLRGLANHQVDPDAFPEFDEPLRAAMIAEGLAYFDQFLHEGRALSEFFSADVNFVDGALAQLYGMSGGAFDPNRPVTVADDERRGFLGLASFLTLTSFAHRTAPTLRGKWVLENLLCTEIPPPPPEVPELESGGASESLNVRERLAEHRQNPQCAGCHTLLDPIGLGLEHFDAIGRYRESYGGGDAVDASGMLPSGESFDGLFELSALLADDPRLYDCASERLLTYALSRELVDGDRVYLDEIRARAGQAGGSVRALLEQIVLSDLFRMRRGEPATATGGQP